MRKSRNARCNVQAGTLREAVINHAYEENMPNSVVEGLRQASDLWLITRRDNSLDDIMRDVKVLPSDPDIARITNDLLEPPTQASETNHKPRETKPGQRDVTFTPETDWMMV